MIAGMMFIIIGLVVLVNAAFRWNSYSQNFPLEHYSKWKVNTTKYIYEAYGDKAVRKYLLFLSFVFIALGILFCVLRTKDIMERVQIAYFPHLHKGDTVSFAGGELTLELVGMADGFTAKRFNIDKNRYEEVEVKAEDMSGDDMLLVKTTLTNNSSGTLSIVHEDLKFYAKPKSGNNIKGHSVVDGYLYHDDPIELAEGESVTVWFWMSFTKEEKGESYWLVLQYGNTGGLLQPLS